MCGYSVARGVRQSTRGAHTRGADRSTVVARASRLHWLGMALFWALAVFVLLLVTFTFKLTLEHIHEGLIHTWHWVHTPLTVLQASLAAGFLVALALWFRPPHDYTAPYKASALIDLEAELHRSLDRSLEPLRRENVELRAKLGMPLATVLPQGLSQVTDALSADALHPLVVHPSVTSLPPAPGLPVRCSQITPPKHCHAPPFGVIPLAIVISQGPVSACGADNGPLVRQGRHLWQNKHGRFVRRTITLHSSLLAICKRSSRPETTVSVARGSTSVHPLASVPMSPMHERLYPLRLQAGEGKLVVIGLESPSEQQEWHRALLSLGSLALPKDGAGGGHAGGVPAGTAGGGVPAALAVNVVSVPSGTTVGRDPVVAVPAGGGMSRADGAAAGAAAERSYDRSSALDAVHRKAACQRRALAAGAHTLKHKAEPADVARRGSFAASCAAAVAHLEGSRAEPLEAYRRIPQPRESDSRFLLVDRSFTHGLGHEVLVYNVALRMALDLNLTLVHLPLLSHSDRYVKSPAHLFNSPTHS